MNYSSTSKKRCSWIKDEEEVVEQPADQNHRLVFCTHGDHPLCGGLVHVLLIPESNRRSGHQAGLGDCPIKNRGNPASISLHVESLLEPGYP